MQDKVVIRIPFHLAHVPSARLAPCRLRRSDKTVADFAVFDHLLADDWAPSAAGFVDPVSQEEWVGSVDPALYDVRMLSDVYKQPDGTVKHENLRCTWDKVKSSFSNVAFRFNPEGFGFYQWPHIEIKASPAKILQGHNVYGSEFIRAGVEEMFYLISTAYPDLWAHLDHQQAQLRWLDCTMSADLGSQFMCKSMIAFLSSIADKNFVSDRRGEWPTVYWSKDSDYVSLKAYIKSIELLKDIDAAKKTKHAYRVTALQSALEFSMNKIRLEASVKYRKLLTLGIPTNLFEYMKFEEWFFSVHGESVCKYLWELSFKCILSDLEGHTMRNVDDDLIETKIYAALTIVDKNGKLERRTATGVWHTYQDICRCGYKVLAAKKSVTFFRHVKLMTTKCGLSKAFLKSLGGVHTNVVPLVTVMTFDFTKQRPDNWVEPYCLTSRSHYVEPHLRLVG